MIEERRRSRRLSAPDSRSCAPESVRGHDGNPISEIRPYEDSDWSAVWDLIRPVFQQGETYPAPPDIAAPEAREYWVETPAATYVALGEDGALLGSFYLKPNQPGLGDHVCNCGYIVSPAAQGRGIGSALCAYSQRVAREHGFTAMQYNLVVSTNHAAIKVWKNNGFHIVGTLPKAFRHARLGPVDALVMYKALSGQG